MLSDQAHAEILRRVAAKTVVEARAAWEKARSSDDIASIRSAFRACVLAARALRRAGRDATKLDAAAADLKSRLALALAG